MKHLISNILKIISIIFNRTALRKPDFSEKKILLQGKILESETNKKDIINDFKDVEYSVFSQFGEDGIISWILNKIPNIEKVFLEIGTEDYWESNTRFLLKSSNWKGYLIEASAKDVIKIKSQRIYWQHKLKAINEFVDKENVNTIIKENIKEKKIGLLSIDIDGNDYWILKEITAVDPSLVVCEYNSMFGDMHKIASVYDKNFDRSKKHHTNLYFGASIKAMIDMMNEKGYFFLGTNSTGLNAYFLKKELCKYLENNIKHKHSFPTTAREGLDLDGKLTFDSIEKNIKKIQHLDVFDIEEDKLKNISDYNNLYSDRWKELIN